MAFKCNGVSHLSATAPTMSLPASTSYKSRHRSHFFSGAPTSYSNPCLMLPHFLLISSPSPEFVLLHLSGPRTFGWRQGLLPKERIVFMGNNIDDFVTDQSTAFFRRSELGKGFWALLSVLLASNSGVRVYK